jgi:hypothetical protein
MTGPRVANPEPAGDTTGSPATSGACEDGEARKLADVSQGPDEWAPDGPNCPKCGSHDYAFWVNDDATLVADRAAYAPPCATGGCPLNIGDRDIMPANQAFAPTWSPSPPNEPGWYWFAWWASKAEKWAVRTVHVWQTSMGEILTSDAASDLAVDDECATPFDVQYHGGLWWSEPIAIPQLPKESP